MGRRRYFDTNWSGHAERSARPSTSIKTEGPSSDSNGDPTMWICLFFIARAFSLLSFLLVFSNLLARLRRRGR
jgi:hypothetical protein